MFQKPFRVKTQTAVKNSDRKKLRSDLKSQYPSLTEEDAAELIPNKEEMILTKASTHGGDILQIYYVKKIPLVFEHYKKLFPTVYTLWRFPDLLPVFRTWPPVFEKLQNGADLMMPGVLNESEPGPKMFGNLQKGDKVSVSLVGNRYPVAWGHALLSGEDMYLSGLKGKGVTISHIVGDTLWESGDKSLPPMETQAVPLDLGAAEGAAGEEVASNGAGVDGMGELQIQDTSEENAGATGNSEENNVDRSDSEEEEEKDPVAEMDKLLDFCFACAIKSRIKQSDLPLLTVNLMRDFMQPFSPAARLDVKKSSFKKLSKFLQKKVSDAYITTKEQSKGVDVITTIDKSHPGLRDLDVPEAVEEENSNEATEVEEEVNKPLVFTDVHCVNDTTQELFKGARVKKGEALKLADVRELVTKYIKDNNLQQGDPKMVTLDPILAHTILKASEGDLDHMPWEQVINRVVGKMQPGVAISSSEGLVTIKKGKMDPIKLDVMMRASNKKVTVVENLEAYGIDVKAFARTVQRAVACSCTVVASEEKNKGPQVQVQGNQITFIGNMLLEKLKIPKKYVVGLDKAPKQKKKK